MLDASPPLYPRARKRSFSARLRAASRALRWSLARVFVRLAFVIGKGTRTSYQPVRIGRRAGRGARDAETRWQAIAETLRRHEARSVLDIGCAEGFFVRRAAEELGCFAIGVEASNRAALGSLALIHDRTEGAAIVRAFVGAGDLRGLPQFDAVICMSVAHHVLRAHGIDAAQEFIAACAARAARVLIFEMGTAAEKSFEDALPSGGRDQESFVRALLEGAGLTNVRTIAATRAFDGKATRLLFAAEPAAPHTETVSRAASLPG